MRRMEKVGLPYNFNLSEEENKKIFREAGYSISDTIKDSTIYSLGAVGALLLVLILWCINKSETRRVILYNFIILYRRRRQSYLPELAQYFFDSRPFTFSQPVHNS